MAVSIKAKGFLRPVELKIADFFARKEDRVAERPITE
jgi:hypothetical protein